MENQEKEGTLEVTLLEIEEIIEQLQQRDISLEDSFSLYQRGIEKLKVCNEKIDAVEKKLLILNNDGNDCNYSEE